VGENTTAYRRFADFYPFYLSQHANRSCRRLHFAGTTLAWSGHVGRIRF
jgi:hypothetical protein